MQNYARYNIIQSEKLCYVPNYARATLCHVPHYVIYEIRDALREKNGIMWEKFPNVGPPPPNPPVWERPVFNNKKVGFIFHFRT